MNCACLTAKPGDGSKAIVEYCQNLCPDNILLVTTKKLEASSTRSKWFKALDEAGASVQCWPIEPKQLPGWISQRLRATGLNADNEAAQMIAERVEGNLLAAMQEIEKLRLFVDGDTVTADHGHRSGGR